MFLSLLTVVLHTWTAATLYLPSNVQLLPNASSIDPILAIPSTNSTSVTENQECFSGQPLFPPSYTDCFNAAQEILQGFRNPHRSVTFARRDGIGFRLPRVIKYGSCVISLDVPSDNDKDRFQPWTAYAAALSVVEKCVEGVHRLGGQRTVGGKNVVTLMVFGENRSAEDGNGENGGSMLEPSNVTTVDVRDRAVDPARTLNTSTLNSASEMPLNSSSLALDLVCVEAPRTHEVRFPPYQNDCYQAADSIIQGRPRNIPLTFSRHPDATFRLPLSVAHGTCFIHIKLSNPDDEDTFELWTLYGAALDVANRCTVSPTEQINKCGGAKLTGPKNLVNVMVMGFALSDAVSADSTSGSARLIARAQTARNPPEVDAPPSKNSRVADLYLPGDGGIPNLNTSEVILNGSSPSTVPSLGGILSCYDPPLPRERLYPYDFSDCEEASNQIIGTRNKWQRFVFSRTPVRGPEPWYKLPARFEYRSCVIVVDMSNDKDKDVVTVNFVASSAWVLAHKCSGKEVPQYKYGGYMTVSVGARDLINIHVYGRPRPLPLGQSDVVALPQNTSSVDRER